MSSTSLKIRRNVRGIVFDPHYDPIQFLILFSNRKGGYWQFPGGGVESGQTLVEAVTEEVSDESGILDFEVLEDVTYVTEYNSKRNNQPQHVVLTAFAVMADLRNQTPRPNPSEGHVDYAILEYIRTYRRLTKYPQQREVLHAISKMLYRTKGFSVF